LGRMDTWTEEIESDVKEAITGGRFKSAEPSKNLVDGLWKLETWKKESALGGLTIRSQTIRHIDDAVASYHQANWNKLCPQRYKAMVDIILKIAKLRQQKPES